MSDHEKEMMRELLESDWIAEEIEKYTAKKGAEYQEIPRCTLSRKIDRRLARTVRAGLWQTRPRASWRRKSAWAAAILLALLAVSNVSAIRSVIGNYILTRKEESLDFSETPHPDQGTWHTGTSLPTDLPPGYELSEAASYVSVMEFVYSKPWKPDIRLIIYADNTCLRLDGENVDEISKITINGRDGYYIIKKNRMQLFWGKGPAFCIQGPSAERDALVRMAESIVYTPADGQKY